MARKKKEVKEELKELEVEELKDEEETPEVTTLTPDERVAKATQEISKILTEYNCALDTMVILRRNQVTPDIRVVPLKEKEENEESF